jgi:hypothetical protein
MPFEIQGINFTGFARIDMDKLIQLDYPGRVNWLRHRLELVFLTPFRKLVALDGPDSYVWLCALSLLCTAIEALADFEFTGNGMQRFSAFTEKYFSNEFKSAGLHLDDPKPTKFQIATTPAQHLYKYFRCGLAHSFCIEWGGILHREDGAPSYLFERNPVENQRSLGIVPRELVADFQEAAQRFFESALVWKQGTPAADNFNRQFAEVFLICSRPPTP